MASAAEPILASTLYDAVATQLPDTEGAPSPKRRRLLTGCAPVDHVLGDGLVYGDGGICCISGETGRGAQEICQQLLVSHLLEEEEGEGDATLNGVSVIDTLGAFDVLSLHRSIASRLETRDRTAQAHAQARARQPMEDLSERAARLLDRVKIMRVFDFEGMLECIDEIRDRPDTLGASGPDDETETVQEAAKGTAVTKDQDEMLDELANPLPAAAAGASMKPAFTPPQRDGYGMLVIDNLTQIVAPLLKNNYVQGQALLTTFMRNLNRAHNLSTILLNTAVTYRNAQDPPSIFASTTAQPALGKTFPYLVDTHLFVSRVPKTERDAMAVYGNARSGPGGKGQAEWVNVVEVLQDRVGGRAGRFGVFGVDGYGGLKKVF
ncbi:hypothetical protein H2203_007842 [Taxawa tesnikishii (nom. ined.)]|nr:hypothetical protein H2203_007842 [Dothideales sp. JES 119]